MPRYDDRWWDHAPSAPREARGGIKAHSKRGAFASTWWGQRWLAVLEALDLGGRLARGRSYARRGQVLDLAIEPGKVSADVQGSRPRSYAVAIRIDRIGRADWKRLAQDVSANLRIAAALLAGEMPPELEEACAGAGLPLFPRRAEELATSCSCPDWSNPCKHVAAVYYLLAEAFDRDPFLLFRLRGISREEFVAMLGAAPRPAGDEGAPRGEAAPPPERTESLPTDPAAFWRGMPAPGNLVGDVAPPALAAPFVRRLGAFPFWRGEEDLFEALARSYGAAAERGIRVAAGGLGGEAADDTEPAGFPSS